jgi:hypothetical protein
MTLFVWVCFYIWTLSLFESLSNYVFVHTYLNLCLYEFIWKFEGMYVWIILFEFWRFVCLHEPWKFVYLSLVEIFSNSLSLGLSFNFNLSLEVSYVLLIVQCLSLNLCVICMSIMCVNYISIFVCVWVMCPYFWILCLKFSIFLVVKQLLNNGKCFFSCILKDFIT